MYQGKIRDRTGLCRRQPQDKLLTAVTHHQGSPPAKAPPPGLTCCSGILFVEVEIVSEHQPPLQPPEVPPCQAAQCSARQQRQWHAALDQERRQQRGRRGQRAGRRAVAAARSRQQRGLCQRERCPCRNASGGCHRKHATQAAHCRESLQCKGRWRAYCCAACKFIQPAATGTVRSNQEGLVKGALNQLMHAKPAHPATLKSMAGPLARRQLGQCWVCCPYRSRICWRLMGGRACSGGNCCWPERMAPSGAWAAGRTAGQQLLGKSTWQERVVHSCIDRRKGRLTPPSCISHRGEIHPIPACPHAWPLACNGAPCGP